MADVFNSKHSCADIEEILDSAGLVSSAEDENYSVKIVDSAGTLLLGIKLTGELDVPIGITDDAYNLIEALYDKLNNAITALKSYTDSTKSSIEMSFDRIEDRAALISQTDDDEHVVKMVDASGNLLQGIKTNGEINTPNGITDGAYQVCYALYDKMKQITAELKVLTEKVDNLS